MTPARLALMTAVGPPDCATKRFPVSSDIIFHLIRCRAEPHRPLFFGKPSKSGRNVANEPSACQSGNHKARKDARVSVEPPARGHSCPQQRSMAKMASEVAGACCGQECPRADLVPLPSYVPDSARTHERGWDGASPACLLISMWRVWGRGHPHPCGRASCIRAVPDSPPPEQD